MKIDAFPHIFPKSCLERFRDVASGHPRAFLQGLEALQPLYDLDLRFRLLDALGDYREILTLSWPPIDYVAPNDTGIDLARLVNDTLADLVAKYPDRFIGFAASLPLHDGEAAAREAERAVTQLGAMGVQMFTNAAGRSLDHPSLAPLWAGMAGLDRPVWLHGARRPRPPEFEDEQESAFGLWQSLGWPSEMGFCLARLVCSGVLERYPALRLLAHHGGGTLPMFGQRVNPAGPPGSAGADRNAAAGLTKDPSEYFKMLYADTTVNGSAIALQASISYFGADHVLYGSDLPFGRGSSGLGATERTIEILESLPLSEDEREMIFRGNAERVLGAVVPR